MVQTNSSFGPSCDAILSAMRNQLNCLFIFRTNFFCAKSRLDIANSFFIVVNPIYLLPVYQRVVVD